MRGAGFFVNRERHNPFPCETMKPSFQVTVARLENDRASAPFSRSGIPRRGLKPGWNLEDTPAPLRAETPGSVDDLPAASLARLRRLQALAQGRGSHGVTVEIPAATTAESTRKIMMPFNPPRFHIPKKGKNAGKSVELKWCLRLITRTVSLASGTAVASATARCAGETVKPPGSASGRGFSNVYLDFKSRWGADKAAELVSFLKFSDAAEA